MLKEACIKDLLVFVDYTNLAKMGGGGTRRSCINYVGLRKLKSILHFRLKKNIFALNFE